VERRRTVAPCSEDLVAVAAGADLLIVDAQYDEKTYAERIKWGHSSCFSVTDLAIRAKVKNLALSIMIPKTPTAASTRKWSPAAGAPPVTAQNLPSARRARCRDEILRGAHPASTGSTLAQAGLRFLESSVCASRRISGIRSRKGLFWRTA